MIAMAIAIICVSNVKHGEKMSDEDEEALAKAVEAADD